MAGHELVVGDVDQQVLLEEALDLGQVLDGGEGLACRGGQGAVGDHDSRLVLVGDDVLGEVADLTDAEGRVAEELDPDGAAVGGGIGVGVGLWGGVFSEHGVAGASRELELAATDAREQRLARKLSHGKTNGGRWEVGKRTHFTEPSGLQ